MTETPYRLLKDLHKLSEVDDWIYYDETIRLPSAMLSDLQEISSLLSARGITFGYVLLQYNVDAMFVNVYDVNKQMVDIKPRSFRGFTVILKNVIT
jgi:hypothetical protein